MQPGIIKVALGFFLAVLPAFRPSSSRMLVRRSPRIKRPVMKPIRIVLSPTRSRPLNLFLGLVLLLVSLLVLFALATYHAADPSLNTATVTDPAGSYAVHNWIGPFGSYLSDLLLQTLGLTAFLLPLWLGGIGYSWMRSRPSGSALLRWMGTLLALTFLPAAFGLTPWHWRWMHMVPVEGVVGRLMAGLLVSYLNIQGAWLVAGVFALAGLYFASAISFWVIKEAVENYWLHLQSALDRWKNWREQRAEQREEQRLDEEIDRDSNRDRDYAPPATLEFSPAAGPIAAADPNSDAETDHEESVRRPGLLAAFFNRRKRAAQLAQPDPLDDVPAFRRAPLEAADPNQPASAASASAQSRGESAVRPAEETIPITQRRSIWERAEAEAASHAPVQPSSLPAQNVVPMQQPAAARFPDDRSVAATQAPVRHVAPRPEPAGAPAPWPTDEIAIHGRADNEVRSATVAPKSVSGFKLPPSTLLLAGEGPQKVREDELREEAKVLVEKCAEFGVRGQVVQINPGPMVTTYEFKLENGVKYSRVTGLGDDLCLAMRAESILIERMAGKNTVGIQVPNHERETIHLRDVLESETFAKAKSRLTLAMGKDINGRIVTADLNAMPHGLRQIGGHQRHDHEPAVPHHAVAGAPDPG